MGLSCIFAKWPNHKNLTQYLLIRYKFYGSVGHDIDVWQIAWIFFVNIKNSLFIKRREMLSTFFFYHENDETKTSHALRIQQKETKWMIDIKHSKVLLNLQNGVLHFFEFISAKKSTRKVLWFFQTIQKKPPKCKLNIILVTHCNNNYSKLGLSVGRRASQ